VINRSCFEKADHDRVGILLRPDNLCYRGQCVKYATYIDTRLFDV